MRTVIASKPWLTEPALIPLSWSSVQIAEDQALRIGIMWHDGVVLPHPPITRALTMLVRMLKQLSNVEIVDFPAYLHDESWAILSSLYFTDGGTSDLVTIAASGEPLLPLTKFIIQENPCVRKLSLQQLGYWEEEREAYRIEYAKLWCQTGTRGDGGDGDEVEPREMMDVLLCPAAPGVAPRHNTSKYWGYSAQWNLLDYPAVVFPVTKADKKIDTIELGHKHEPMSELDTENWALCEHNPTA